MSNHHEEKSHTGSIVGLAAAAVAAVAGIYFLYGKDGTKNRRKIKGWMLRVKADVLDQLEETGELSKEKYHQVIEEVGKNYEGIKNVDKAELTMLIADLKSHWDNIAEQIKEGKEAAE